MRFSLMALTGLVALELSGCYLGVSDVSGHVSYQGLPVVYGSVVAIAKNKQSFQGAIDSHGDYIIQGIPSNSGTLQVTVHSPNPNPAAPRRRSNDPKGIRKQSQAAKSKPAPYSESSEWFEIPEHYTKVGESGLSITIAGPSVSYDIELN